jgi:hypothetical protein
LFFFFFSNFVFSWNLILTGYRGGRSNWDNNNSRQGFNSGSGGGRWGSAGGEGRGFSDNRSGGGFRGKFSEEQISEYKILFQAEVVVAVVGILSVIVVIVVSFN